jgi:PAS domain S-box-containing protein
MNVARLQSPLLLLDSPPEVAALLYHEDIPFVQTIDKDEFFALVEGMPPPLALVYASADGLAACSYLRQLDTPIPVVAMVEPEDEMIDAALAEGAVDYLILPTSRAALLHRIENALRLDIAQRALDDHERRWQQVFHENQAIKLLTDPVTGKIIDANSAACHFYGYSLEVLREKTLNDLDITPAGTEEAQFGRTLFGFRHITSAGQPREVKMFSSVVQERGRRLLFSIVFDNTKRVAAETAEFSQRALAEALRDTASALSSTLDQDRVLDLILHHVSRVVPGDAANIMLIKHGATQIVRHRGYEWYGTDDIAKVHFSVHEIAVYRWMVTHQQPLVVSDVSRYEGWQSIDQSMWIRALCAAPIRVGKQVIGFLNVDSATPNHFNERDGQRLQAFADQAAIAIRNAGLYNRVRRQAAELERRIHERTAELEAERAQLRAILEAMAEGVVYTELSEGQRVRYINNALTTMTGYSAGEWIEHSLKLFKRPEQTDQEFQDGITGIYQQAVTHNVWHGDIKLPRKDGSTFDALAITTPVRGAAGDVIGLVTVIRDISQQKALELQKTRFVANASHELRTPITNMKTRLYLMRKQPERMDVHLRVMEEVTERMHRLAEDLLAISRFERGTIELRRSVTVLQSLIDSVLSLQLPEFEQKQQKLQVSMPDEPILVFADSERISQVLTNLVVNAINYTPQGGNICIKASIYSAEMACIEVEDTGIGIAPEHLPHIFQPFYRVTYQVQGTGLGLSISREIVELHGGTIWATSTLGKGSCFRFLLPLASS